VVTDTAPTFALVGVPYLEYLPVVDLSNGRLVGMEALVRWQLPTHGLISPTRLIPHAEVSGDIGPLTRWILMEACEKACTWSPSIQLAVNCTIHQLRRGEVSKAVGAALDQTGFRAGQLTLEVTEDAIVDSSASADLRTLSGMGVQLSVDDVGTNWSSFEPFKRNSISTVKIDGSFIAGLESTQGINRLVVETVIHMAHSLGMSAIVEWVETAAQVEIVRAFNADAAQGFFFSQPMSSDDAVAFAGGPEVPQFSCAKQRTLVVPHPAGEVQALLGNPPHTGPHTDPCASGSVDRGDPFASEQDPFAVDEAGTDTPGEALDDRGPAGAVEDGSPTAADVGTDEVGPDAEEPDVEGSVVTGGAGVGGTDAPVSEDRVVEVDDPSHSSTDAA
jgi:EAL domain-containing protein (putative c-di-GMP-specific phosphodiesterase class I)